MYGCCIPLHPPSRQEFGPGIEKSQLRRAYRERMSNIILGQRNRKTAWIRPRKWTILLTHIRPDFQLSGTLKLMDVDGAASHLRTMISISIMVLLNKTWKHTQSPLSEWQFPHWDLWRQLAFVSCISLEEWCEHRGSTLTKLWTDNYSLLWMFAQE